MLPSGHTLRNNNCRSVDSNGTSRRTRCRYDKPTLSASTGLRPSTPIRTVSIGGNITATRPRDGGDSTTLERREAREATKEWSALSRACFQIRRGPRAERICDALLTPDQEGCLIRGFLATVAS